MSGFLPDLASWALRGGAAGGGGGGGAASSSSSNPAGGNDPAPPPTLTEEQVRARRLARMEELQQQSNSNTSHSDGGTADLVQQPMDVVVDTDTVAEDAPTTMTTIAPTNTQQQQQQQPPPPPPPLRVSRKDPPPHPPSHQPPPSHDPKKKRIKESDGGTTTPQPTTTGSTMKTNVVSSSSLDRMTKKNQRRKELLVKKVLLVTLPNSHHTTTTNTTGSSSSSSTGLDAMCIPLVDVDITSNQGGGITVQTIAEILVARLSLSPNAPEFMTLNHNHILNKPILPYLAQCHKRASEEIQWLRQQQQPTTTSSTSSSYDSSSLELEEILFEIKRQVVSYAASSLMEPDLFEMGTNGSYELAKCLIHPSYTATMLSSTSSSSSSTTTSSSSPSDSMTNSITFGVSGISSSFYYCLCEELISQDAITFEKVIGDVVRYITQSLLQCETVLDMTTMIIHHEGGGTDGNGSSGSGARHTTTSMTMNPVNGLMLVTAMTSLGCHKKAAACLTKLSQFLLPPVNDVRAMERIRPTPPPSVNPNNESLGSFLSSSSSQQEQQQQQQLRRRWYQMMQAISSPGYLKRSGPGLDHDTILGSILRLGCPRDHPTITSSFTGGGSMLLQTLDSMERSTQSHRSQLRLYQEGCHQFLRTLVTAGPEARNHVMTWFKDALLVNTGASAMRPDSTKVSSAPTLLNLAVVLLKLCEPFMQDVTKQDLIDPGFVSSPNDHGGVYATTGEQAVSRLGEIPDDNNDDDQMSTTTSTYRPKNSFIPQCFFFTARALHLSLVPLLSYHHNLLRQIGHMHWELRSQNRDLHTNPEFNYLLSLQRANEVALFQEELISDGLEFCNLMARFLFTIDDSQLRCMPEHFPFDICDIIMNVSRLKSSLLQRKEFRFVFHMVVKFLSPKYANMVRNYNLRAKLGDVLYEIFLPEDPSDHRNVTSSIAFDPLAGGRTYLLSDGAAQETLAPSLLLLYGEVEHTGYYDKMSHRANIASLLKYLWESSEHRPAFRRITQNKESFIKFANGIMNETNTLIATVMQKLPEIRAAQIQMANGPEWAQLNESEREVISSRLDENEHEVKRALPLCNKTLQMLGYLNTDAEIRALFLLEEMCPRLVTMLFHALTKLVGAKGLELKVNNPEEYNFRPKEMLRDLCAIFSLFASEHEFQMECAKSGCDPDLLSKAIRTCKKLNLLTGESMHAFEMLPELVQQAARSVADIDALLADAPDEFLDEILSTVMRDPVILPSGHIVDRSTIQQHLLNDSSDPFNREQMTVDDIIPATDLKEKMNQWIEGKKKEKYRQTEHLVGSSGNTSGEYKSTKNDMDDDDAMEE